MKIDAEKLEKSIYDIVLFLLLMYWILNKIKVVHSISHTEKKPPEKFDLN